MNNNLSGHAMDMHFIRILILMLYILTTNNLHADTNTYQNDAWNGVYIGVYVDNSGYKSNFETHSKPGSYFINEDYSQLITAGSKSQKENYMSGGIRIGWGYEWNNFVFGIEADYQESGAKIKVNSGDVTYITQPAETFKAINYLNIEHYLSLRPKLGYMWGSTLVYITGGFSLAKMKYSFNFSDTFSNQFSSVETNNTKKGWTIGAGVEHYINNVWSVRIDYLYSEFDSLDASSQLSGYPDQIIYNEVKLKMSSLRLGINHWF